MIATVASSGEFTPWQASGESAPWQSRHSGDPDGQAG